MSDFDVVAPILFALVWGTFIGPSFLHWTLTGRWRWRWWS